MKYSLCIILLCTSFLIRSNNNESLNSKKEAMIQKINKDAEKEMKQIEESEINKVGLIFLLGMITAGLSGVMYAQIMENYKINNFRVFVDLLPSAAVITWLSLLTKNFISNENNYKYQKLLEVTRNKNNRLLEIEKIIFTEEKFAH